ncbi:MAG: alpha/beta hydrolase [Aureliella sp.]
MKTRALTLTFILLAFHIEASAQDTEMKLWPDTPPGRVVATEPEADTTKPDGREVAGKRVIRLGNVSEPMLTVYSPPEDKNTGAAVLVCPGGGYHILAYDLEGTEVCVWLNSIGVTGVVLKYRVPRPKGDPRPVEALQDAQRAMGLIRENAEKWQIDPSRIGVLGFSAGGHLSARLSTNFSERSYDAVDDADKQSCRPDFAVLIYPAYLYERDEKEESLVSPMLPVDSGTPPMFLTMAFDDRVGPENILRMGLALKKHDVASEVHLYPTGGHGYGLRPTEHHATSWPARCAEWMQASGFLSRDSK